MPGVLDVDGYNPSGLQAPYGATGEETQKTEKKQAAAPSQGTPSQNMDKAIALISKQRIGVSALLSWSFVGDLSQRYRFRVSTNMLF